LFSEVQEPLIAAGWLSAFHHFLIVGRQRVLGMHGYICLPTK
jgi:hypothetical protein